MTRRSVLVGVLLACGLMLAMTPLAHAAPPATAAELAADCNDDGTVVVTGTQRYRGGIGILAGGCSINLDTAATLVLRDVVLRGPSFLVAISSPAETTINVIGSDIEVGGALELTAGCCAGDQLVPEQDGTVVVRRSRLQGASVQLVASFDWPDGVVRVSRTDVIATGPAGIQMRASDLNGSDGRVSVTRSNLTSGGDILAATGTRGRTTFVRNVHNALGTATVTTGAGGRCRSTRNTPAISCS